MAKPLMVIVEKDMEHLIPLQLKMAETLIDIADIEVISDVEYMEEYFIEPKTIDILLIEEELYSEKLSKHIIYKTFVLTDDMGENDEAVYRMKNSHSDTVYLFKYCSIDALIRHVIPFEWNNSKASPKEPQIIAVISPAGGTGTTTVAVGICSCLKQNLKRVLYLNTQNYQNFSYYLENESTLPMEGYNLLKKTDARIYENLMAYLAREDFFYLPPLNSSREMRGITIEHYGNLARAAQKSGKYDFVVVEIGNELSEDALKFLGHANKILVIVNQDAYSLSKLHVMQHSVNCSDKEKFLFICNKFEKEKENAFVTGTEKSVTTISDYIEKSADDKVLRKCKDISKLEGIQRLTVTLI